MSIWNICHVDLFVDMSAGSRKPSILDRPLSKSRAEVRAEADLATVAEVVRPPSGLTDKKNC